MREALRKAGESKGHWCRRKRAMRNEGRRTMELARHAAQQLSELTIRGAGKLGANLYVQPEATVF